MNAIKTSHWIIAFILATFILAGCVGNPTQSTATETARPAIIKSVVLQPTATATPPATDTAHTPSPTVTATALPATVEELIEKLRVRKLSVREEAVRALVAIGAPAVPQLIAALKDDDSVVEYHAQEALAQIGEPAIKSLLATLRDEDIQVQWSAAETLGKMGAPAVES